MAAFSLGAGFREEEEERGEAGPVPVEVDW